MDLNICSLSGEAVATIKALTSESVADLKDKIGKNSNSTSLAIDEVTIVLDGEFLADDRRLDELHIKSDSQWVLVRSRKSAREILFADQEVASALAKHYDSLQDECREAIGTLFLDQEGKARSVNTTAEVLIALRQKLFEPAGCSGLLALKAALTDVALEVYHSEEPHRYKKELVACFAWFGLEAVQKLLEQTAFDSELPFGGDVCEMQRKVLAHEFAKLPNATLRELRHQLPPMSSASAPRDLLLRLRLIAILEQALVPVKRRSAPIRTKAETTQAVQPCQSQPTPCLETVGALLDLLRSRPCRLHSSGKGVELRTCTAGFFYGFTHRAPISVVLAAIQQEPHCVMPTLDWQLAHTAVQLHAGTYQFLPEGLRNDRAILHAALECDTMLHTEFMRTAGKSEICQWKWHAEAYGKNKH